MTDRTIQKFPLERGATHLWVPSRPVFLHVGIDPVGRLSPRVAVWLEVDSPASGDKVDMVRATFELWPTGQVLEPDVDRVHASSVVDLERSMVWHVYWVDDAVAPVVPANLLQEVCAELGVRPGWPPGVLPWNRPFRQQLNNQGRPA